MINKYALKRNYQFTNLKIENPSRIKQAHNSRFIQHFYQREIRLFRTKL